VLAISLHGETPSLVTSASLACFTADSKKAAFYDLFTIAAPKTKVEKRRFSKKEVIWLALTDDFRTLEWNQITRELADFSELSVLGQR
jgi:hypothetical protein